LWFVLSVVMTAGASGLCATGGGVTSVRELQGYLDSSCGCARGVTRRFMQVIHVCRGPYA
jgi:hypothetical protein